MPVASYSVLKGDPVSGKLVFGNSPHYQIQVKAKGATITVAVNVQSADHSEVLYVVDHAFQPPDPAALEKLDDGLTQLARKESGLALDFVRSRVNGDPMVTRDVMSLLPKSRKAGGRHNDLNNEVVDLLHRAIVDKEGTIYAFGSAYHDPDGTQGIHDIHMNQGNPRGNHDGDNGVWQDGGIFMSLPATKTWIAVFIAFQTQSWDTDNKTGNAI
ncbi:MAG TPA: YukJ family protein [Candidatus Angelobacter sp.]|jgi:uncharacterized protein YukJ